MQWKYLTNTEGYEFRAAILAFNVITNRNSKHNISCIMAYHGKETASKENAVSNKFFHKF